MEVHGHNKVLPWVITPWSFEDFRIQNLDILPCTVAIAKPYIIKHI